MPKVKESKTGKCIIEHVCPVCKKIFIASPEHIYREHGTKRRLVCSYACDMKSFKENEAKKKRSKEK